VGEFGCVEAVWIRAGQVVGAVSLSASLMKA
jgi:hypothetical protein